MDIVENVRAAPIIDKHKISLFKHDSKTLKDVAFRLVDLLGGDLSTLNYIESLDIEKILAALSYIIQNEKLTENQKIFLINNTWRIYYKAKPPTPEEFLTEKYIGRMAENIYPRVRKWFLEFMDEKKPYRNACLYTFIGSGKSTLSALITLYITTHVSLMRDPKKYFNLSPASVLANVLCSYSLKKSAELLLEPLTNILEVSDYFVKVRMREEMIKLEEEYKKSKTAEKIYWTTASLQSTSALTFSNGISYKLVSNVQNLLGLSILCGTMTEISFFRDAGKSDEYVMRFFNDLKSRIESRMKGNYFGRSILDSSPNDIDSPIDRYIVFEARKDPTNFVISGSRWEWCPEDFKNPHDTFPVFKGGNGNPPAILSSAEGYNPEDIIYVPRELYQLFHDNLEKALKDIGGIPSGSVDKVFNDHKKIENIFIENMKNIYFCIRADARMPPQKLIWNQIKQQLFLQNGPRYRFYYKPFLPRVFHIDQAISSDMAAIAVCHIERKKKEELKEFDIDRDIMYIIDFVVPIHPYGGRINLDAIKEFILDLYIEGGLSLIHGSFDSYQSEANIQHLQRQGIEIEHLSVDKTLDPYLFLAQCVEQGNLKMGKNIFFKNNLKSLRILPRKLTKTLKIDHTLGDTVDINNCDINWETSLAGKNAKDVSDAVCGAVYLAKKYLTSRMDSLKEEWNEGSAFFTPERIQVNTKTLLQTFGLKIPGEI